MNDGQIKANLQKLNILRSKDPPPCDMLPQVCFGSLPCFFATPYLIKPHMPRPGVTSQRCWLGSPMLFREEDTEWSVAQRDLNRKPFWDNYWLTTEPFLAHCNSAFHATYYFRLVFLLVGDSCTKCNECVDAPRRKRMRGESDAQMR